MKRTLLLAVFLSLVAGAEDPPPTPATAAKGPAIRLRQESGKPVVFEVTGLPSTDLAKLADAKLDSDRWSALFAVTVEEEGKTGGKQLPPMAGSYGVEKGTLSFQPRFPLTPGVRYRAVFHPDRLPGRQSEKAEPLVARFSLTAPHAPPTVVEQVYPTAKELPENHLRFYIHFSAPMSRGDVYRHIRLLDPAGKPVPYPFLELDEELWDPQGKRFTLFFHPGRVKKGLKPREEMGPILQEGKTYTLVIDREWEDAQGRPLAKAFHKTFRAGPAQESFPEIKTWKITPPSAGSRDPLIVDLPKPLDHALLERLLWITDAEGRRIKGEAAILRQETRWSLAPEAAWRPGPYRLVADTALEDLAGNSIARPFEVDVLHPIQRRIKSTTVDLPFKIGERAP